MVLTSTTGPYAISDELVQFQAQRVKGDGHILLCVDDEPDALYVLDRYFREHYTVWTATDGTSALKMLRESSETVSAIISDQRMPGISGTEFLASIRQDFPLSIRILTSACADLDDLIDAVNSSHCHNFVRKPWKLEELDRVVAEAVAMSVLMQRFQIPEPASSMMLV